MSNIEVNSSSQIFDTFSIDVKKLLWNVAEYISFIFRDSNHSSTLFVDTDLISSSDTKIKKRETLVYQLAHLEKNFVIDAHIYVYLQNYKLTCTIAFFL